MADTSDRIEALHVTLVEVRTQQRANVDLLNEIRDLAKATNGRLREAETQIAVLKDREERGAAEGRKHGAIAGSVIAGLITGLAAYFKQ